MKIPSCPVLRSFLFCSLAAPGLFAAVAPPKAELPLVPDGFKIELYAKEPLIHNPCAMAFDARGRLFVGHGPQYRNPTPQTPPDSIAILIDRDGDGVADATKTFATGFNTIQGMAWRGRDLWVGNAPDLTIVRDLDGDDEADEYVVVYTDLGNVEHGVHGLNWAPDGKLYLSKGNSKGLTQPGRIAPKPFRDLWDVTAPAGSPDFPPPRTFRKGDYKAAYQDPRDDWGREGGVLRSDPDGSNLEIVARGMRNPFDIAFDSAFNWLGMDNDQSEGDRIIMPFASGHFGWGHHWSSHWTGYRHVPTVPAAGPIFHGSGTGLIYYDLPQMPDSHRGVWFMNDFLRQITYVYRPRWDGALLQPEGGAWEEFARGRDALFKPVDIDAGPDGALYLSGWGDQLGVVWKDGVQANEGRIFRISWAGAPRANWNTAKRAKPAAQWTFAELVEEFAAPLPIWRTNAQEELVRRGTAVKADLRTLLARADLDSGTQTWALWTLGRIAPQDAEIDTWLATQVNRGTLNVRLQAVRILAHRIREYRPDAQLPASAVEALASGEPRLRFAAALAIGQARQKHLVGALLGYVATESDRLGFYAGWQALRALATPAELTAALADYRGGVRRAALLALLENHALDRDAVTAMVRDRDAATAEVAALWLAKQSGNPLIVMHPKPGEFREPFVLKFTPGLKPGQVFFTTDGSEPSPAKRSGNTVRIADTTTVKVGLFVDGRQVGRTAELVWRKRPARTATTTAELAPPAQPTTVADVLPLLPRANPANGHALMQAAACFTCHRVGDEGQTVGPDLSFLSERGDTAHVIRSILEPNAVITEGYSMLSTTLRDGKTVAGIFQSETDRDLTLMQLDGEAVTLAKDDITRRESSHISIMPPFAGALSPTQVADMVAWLMSRRAPAVRLGAMAAPAGNVATSATTASVPTVAPAAALTWERHADRIAIRGVDGPVMDFVFNHPETLRPHFQNAHAPGGIQITRQFPPSAPELTDHGPLHPGIGMALGDVNGFDYWRNKAKLEHVRFTADPAIRNGRLEFATESRFLSPTGEPLGTLQQRLALWREGDAHWMLWDTEIQAGDRPLELGDQEEMGLALRVTARLIERNGGSVLNSAGDRGAKVAWSKVADWCEYAGTLGDRRVGATMFAHPENPVRTWWHVRDYGLMSANAFGKRVLPAEANGKIVLKPGATHRLRYGVMLFNAPVTGGAEPATAFTRYVQAAGR